MEDYKQLDLGILLYQPFTVMWPNLNSLWWTVRHNDSLKFRTSVIMGALVTEDTRYVQLVSWSARCAVTSDTYEVLSQEEIAFPRLKSWLPVRWSHHHVWQKCCMPFSAVISFIGPASLVGRSSQSFRHTTSPSGLEEHPKAFRPSPSSAHWFRGLWEGNQLKRQLPELKGGWCLWSKVGIGMPESW